MAMARRRRCLKCLNCRDFPADPAQSRLIPPRRLELPCDCSFHITAQAGCDKRFATCRDKFGNGVNFRGFPHLPGNDFIIGGTGAGDPGAGPFDGGSLFR